MLGGIVKWIWESVHYPWVRPVMVAVCSAAWVTQAVASPHTVAYQVAGVVKDACIVAGVASFGTSPAAPAPLPGDAPLRVAPGDSRDMKW